MERDVVAGPVAITTSSAATGVFTSFESWLLAFTMLTCMSQQFALSHAGQAHLLRRFPTNCSTAIRPGGPMALSYPDDCRYADSHEYARAEEELVRIGISAFAVDQLGDIVFVELPEVGDSLSQGSSFGSVESVKAVEEVIAPISGLIEARNEAVLASPEELQNDPYGEGWLLLVRPSDPAQFQGLMDAATYSAKVDGH